MLILRGGLTGCRAGRGKESEESGMAVQGAYAEGNLQVPAQRWEWDPGVRKGSAGPSLLGGPTVLRGGMGKVPGNNHCARVRAERAESSGD